MKIGFIGLGIMGHGMATNLLKNGVDLFIYNRSKVKAIDLIEAGAHWVDSPAHFGEVDILFTMLAHPEAVTAVSQGSNGFLSHLKKDALWVDCSTLNPTFVKEMAKQAQAHHIRYLEAPVAGTKPQAESGSLVFFTGGNQADVELCDPFFQTMGQKVIPVGEVGQASSLKLVVNLMLATSMAAFAEGIAFGESLGISQERLFNVLIGGPVTPPYLASKRSKLETQEYSPQFPLKWMHKDLQMVSLAAYESQIPMPIAQTTKELYGQAIKAGFGDNDLSAIYAYLKA